MSASTPAGWYPDPYDATQLRYWDGVVWTDAVAPVGSPSGSHAGSPSGSDGGSQPRSGAGSPSGTDGGFPSGDDAGSPSGSADETVTMSAGTPHGTTREYHPDIGAAAGGAFGATPEAGPRAAPTGPPSSGSAWETGGAPGFGGGHGPVGAAVVGAGGSGLGDIGQWLGSIFTKLIERLVPLLVLMFAVPAITVVIGAVLVQRLLAGLVIDLEPASDLDFDITGFSFPLFVAVVLTGVVGALVALVARLAANHQLYTAHAGQPQSLARSVLTGLRRVPRAILGGLVVVVLISVLFAALGLAITVIIGISVGDADGSSPLFALLIVPLVVITLVIAIWMWAKFAFFVVALAVAPAGTNPFSASWGFSRGRFWPVFGRLLLIAVSLWVLWGICNAIFQPIFGSAVANIFQVDVVTGDVLVDGRDIETVDEIRWADILPGPAWFGAVAGIYALGRAMIDAIWLSATTGLYWRGGGKGEI